MKLRFRFLNLDVEFPEKLVKNPVAFKKYLLEVLPSMMVTAAVETVVEDSVDENTLSLEQVSLLMNDELLFLLGQLSPLFKNKQQLIKFEQQLVELASTELTNLLHQNQQPSSSQEASDGKKRAKPPAMEMEVSNEMKSLVRKTLH